MNRNTCWGVTGWKDAWVALGSDAGEEDDQEGTFLTGYGVQRTIDPGVIYVAPPEVTGIRRWHPRQQALVRIYRMPWPEDREPQTRSLLDLHAEIASRRGPISPAEPLLATLDRAVDLLVDTAARLHAHARSLGFLQPDSCRIGTWRDGSIFVLLPDVGFAWDKRSGLMMPRWIAKPALEELFEHSAEQRNDEVLAELGRSNDERDIRTRAAEGAASELADVKLLARLLAASLVGGEEVRRWCRHRGEPCLRSLPGTDVAPATQAEIWDRVIAPALAGQIRTCEELRQRLQVHRPSGHFLHAPPARPWVGWSWLRPAGIAAAAAMLLGALWMSSGPVVRYFQGVPPPFCREIAEDHPLYRRLFELAEIRTKAVGDLALRPRFWELLGECRALYAQLEGRPAACLAGLVEEWLEQAEEEGLAVRNRLRSRPRPTAEEVADLSRALAAIAAARAEAKQSAATGVEPVLQRELRLRGGKPAESPPP